MRHGFFLAERPAVTVAAAKAEHARMEWKIQRAALLPKLSLGGGVATNYYKNLTAGYKAEGFGSQRATRQRALARSFTTTWVSMST